MIRTHVASPTAIVHPASTVTGAASTAMEQVVAPAPYVTHPHLVHTSTMEFRETGAISVHRTRTAEVANTAISQHFLAIMNVKTATSRAKRAQARDQTTASRAHRD